MRDHAPLVIDKFLGLYSRGNIEEVPLDHFTECNNIQFIGASAFASRDGIGRHQQVAAPLTHILRMYNYPTSDANTLLVLTAGGNIYHVVDAVTIFGPILTIPAMTDFGFVPYAGRAYITPFTTELVGGLNRERGLQNEFLYVYKGDGTPARKAAGNPPTISPTVTNGGVGATTPGVHIFGVIFETDTGYLTSPGGLVSHTTVENQAVDFSNVQISPQLFVVRRHIVASRVIEDYDGNVNGYDLFFIPGATIPNNVGTTLSNISFFDEDLLLDATHLKDNFAEIPAGVNLANYHNRLILITPHDNISLGYASSVGEPEAFNQVDGVLLFSPDGNPLTNCAELRDVLYFMKRNRTGSFVDNGDIPATWPFSMVDNAMGCGVHGIATVLDSGSSNIDYLLVASYKGLTLFNGRYILPELTLKIQEVWTSQNFKNNNRMIQIVNDSMKQKLYMVTTDRQILHANYANGFDPKNIRWAPWTFDGKINTLCLINVNELLLGMDQV